MNRPSRSLAVVEPAAEVSQSLPQLCDVCGGDRHVQIVAQEPDVDLDLNCPHCGRRRIPIYVYPMFCDIPRGRTE